MPSYTNELRFSLGRKGQVRAAIDIDYTLVPGSRSGDYYTANDPADLWIDDWAINSLTVLSMNGDETMLPDEFVIRWGFLIHREVETVLADQITTDQLFDLCDGGYLNV